MEVLPLEAESKHKEEAEMSHGDSLIVLSVLLLVSDFSYAALQLTSPAVNYYSWKKWPGHLPAIFIIVIITSISRMLHISLFSFFSLLFYA